MSRSYRKNLVLTDRSTNHRYKFQPDNKTIANRATRRKNKRELQNAVENYDNYSFINNKQYRKLYESYNIVDYKARYNKYYDSFLPKYKFKNK